ncbi:MAG: RsmE family RNA methyltransferase, partial [Sphingomonas sp.]
MTAIPAWPPQSTPRLFVDHPLAPGALRIEGTAAHYLVSVMRMAPGDPVKLFDDVTGEWLATAATVGRRDLTVEVSALLRPREPVPDLWLCAAPLKKGRVDWLAEKACELGVDRLVPVVTQRTVVDRPKLDRLRSH